MSNTTILQTKLLIWMLQHDIAWTNETMRTCGKLVSYVATNWSRLICFVLTVQSFDQVILKLFLHCSNSLRLYREYPHIVEEWFHLYVAMYDVSLTGLKWTGQEKIFPNELASPLLEMKLWYWRQGEQRNGSRI